MNRSPRGLRAKDYADKDDKMKCPHCHKEVFGRGHDVSDFYQEPKELTPEERIEALQAKNKALKYICKYTYLLLTENIGQHTHAIAMLERALKDQPDQT
jgi:hypothetical protein